MHISTLVQNNEVHYDEAESDEETFELDNDFIPTLDNDQVHHLMKLIDREGLQEMHSTIDMYLNETDIEKKKQFLKVQNFNNFSRYIQSLNALKEQVEPAIPTIGVKPATRTRETAPKKSKEKNHFDFLRELRENCQQIYGSLQVQSAITDAVKETIAQVCRFQKIYTNDDLFSLGKEMMQNISAIEQVIKENENLNAVRAWIAKILRGKFFHLVKIYLQSTNHGATWTKFIEDHFSTLSGTQIRRYEKLYTLVDAFPMLHFCTIEAFTRLTDNYDIYFDLMSSEHEINFWTKNFEETVISLDNNWSWSVSTNSDEQQEILNQRVTNLSNYRTFGDEEVKKQEQAEKRKKKELLKKTEAKRTKEQYVCPKCHQHMPYIQRTDHMYLVHNLKVN